MGVQSLKMAEEVREEITQEEQKKIRKAYQKAYHDVKEKIGRESDRFRLISLKELESELEDGIERINKEIEKNIVSDMHNMCEAVVSNKRRYLKEYGFEASKISVAFSHTPDRVVKAIITGKVYNTGWTLSSALWGHTRRVQSDISYVVGQGVASGKTAYEIAKDLEKYIKPESRKKSRVVTFQKYKKDSQGNIIKDKNGEPIKDGSERRFYFGDVDYNAQRLARTLISHAYQQSFEAVNEKDPFVTKYIWHASGQHGRTCPICLDRDGQVFDKNDLPLDHPNGMCTFEAYIPYSDSEILNRLDRWHDAPSGTYPDIDEYAKTFIN